MSFSKGTRLKIYERSNDRCALCGRQFIRPDGYDGHYALWDDSYRNPAGVPKLCALEIDHIHPRFHGGGMGEDHDNLQALCTQCNKRKQHRLPTDQGVSHGSDALD